MDKKLVIFIIIALYSSASFAMQPMPAGDNGFRTAQPAELPTAFTDSTMDEQPLLYWIEKVDGAFICPFCRTTTTQDKKKLAEPSQLIMHIKYCSSKPKDPNWVFVGLPLKNSDQTLMVDWYNQNSMYQCQVCNQYRKRPNEFFSGSCGLTCTTKTIKPKDSPLVEQHSIPDNQQSEGRVAAPVPPQHTLAVPGNVSLPIESGLSQQALPSIPTAQQPRKYRIEKVDGAFKCPFCRTTTNLQGYYLAKLTQLIKHVQNCNIAIKIQDNNWVLTGLTIEKSGRTLMVDWYHQNSMYQCTVCKKYRAKPSEFFSGSCHTCIAKAAHDTTNALGKEMAPIAQPAKLQHIESAQHPTRGYFSSQFQSKLVPYEDIYMAQLQQDAEALHYDDEEQELQSSTAAATVSHKRSHTSQLPEEQQSPAKKRKVESFLQSQPIHTQAPKKSLLTIPLPTTFGNHNVSIFVLFNLAESLKTYWCNFSNCLTLQHFNDIPTLIAHIVNHCKSEPQERIQVVALNNYIKTMVKNVSKTCPNCNTVSYASFKQLREHWHTCNRTIQQTPLAEDKPC